MMPPFVPTNSFIIALTLVLGTMITIGVSFNSFFRSPARSSRSILRLDHYYLTSNSLSRRLFFHPSMSSHGLEKKKSGNKDGLNDLLKKNIPVKFCFVGGKGGVGKTSSSSAIAIHLADAGLRTLVVSTDPAHSLGDALAVDLSNGEINPILTDPYLSALEVDVEKEMDSFRGMAADLDVESLASSFGVSADLLQSLGLADLASVFTNPPPGIDEIIALLKIFQYAQETNSNGQPRFERIVIDTAPTGHTIRLLQLPEFLNTVTGKLIAFRSKLMNAMESLQNMFSGGSGGGSRGSSALNAALNKLETLQANMLKMKTTLTNAEQTQFAVVTIPTTLAVAESKRLVSSLREQGISISSILVNQVIAEESGPKYVATRRQSQQKCIDSVRRATADMNMEITEVNYVDTEVTGIFGLRYFAALAHGNTEAASSKSLTIFGGKGGVGKTTSAASWGVKLSDAGQRVLIISTDPAHSLGDALGERLSGIPRLLDRSMGAGQLWAMEVDPAIALEEFRDMMTESLDVNDQGGSSPSSSATSGLFGGNMLGDIKRDLGDFLSGASNPPPGTDEVVALAKVISYLEDGYSAPDGTIHKFDRIVLDTAPTGHTLRMLQLPQFLRDLISKFKSVKQKTGALGGIFNMMGGRGQPDNANNLEPSRLDLFEQRMDRLEDLLHDRSATEFAIVTIPTELAIAESKRLVDALIEDGIFTRRLIINQVLSRPSTSTGSSITANSDNDDVITNSYLNKLRQGQARSIVELEQVANNEVVSIVTIPYFDLEVRTVYGLRAISNVIFKPS